ncbi:hypothetical protein OIU34_27740 [Pararhizobium sp. BT-229]|uniref:hypothetical protein n=1 Tax=Pararhizobium sp. BT-229 TaxID=2986923 RepID=UPI0021F6C5E1|nr:hypothetical protein [Pararhizobium sp. BT-229]MCV9965671.1 hypothetical protein [Pararhizobium sp. BT-229]
MLKFTLAAALLGTVLSGAAIAQDATMKCDEASMMKLETDTTAMTDAAKKETAMKEMALAKEAMAAKNMEKCTTHMNNAMLGKSSM